MPRKAPPKTEQEAMPPKEKKPRKPKESVEIPAELPGFRKPTCAEQIVVGVDPSLRNTGITVWNVPDCVLIYQTTVKNPPKVMDELLSYRNIYNGVKAVLQEHKPKALFYEKIFQSKNSNITQALFQAQFMVRLAADDMGVPAFMVPTSGPTGWQPFVLGRDYKGNSGMRKILARKVLEKELNVAFTNEHIADSAAIALSGTFFNLKKGAA